LIAFNFLIIPGDGLVTADLQSANAGDVKKSYCLCRLMF